MALIIEGMKKPESCWVCRIEQLIENCPCRLGINNASEYKTKRHPDCPIKDMDKHGNLKDADFIISCLAEIKDTYPRTYEIIKGILDRTPTILEATE
jgi:hypothetical protein